LLLKKVGFDIVMMKLGLNKNSKTIKPSILLPVENQVRELDAKILLACIAARRGFVIVLGPRRQLENRIHSLPRSVYISKSLKSGNARYFKILQKFGHQIVGWDEEALVHFPPDLYIARRVSSMVFKYLSHLFAWGQDSADLLHQYPDITAGIPIHVTGNPRGDLLRPEVRGFYEPDIQKIRKAYGDFILINTNFNRVNAFYAVQNIFQPVKHSTEEPQLGRTAQKMSREDAKGYYEHKHAIFEEFKSLIPKLEQAFPDYTIVVRPHPGENQKIYRSIAAQGQRIQVTNEGNVVPWLMAAKAMIHNGCTTGVEAYALGVPAISYRPSVNQYWDDVYHRLPNRMSHQCYSSEALMATLAKILNGGLGAPSSRECKQFLDYHLAAQRGAFACDRIVDVLADMKGNVAQTPNRELTDRLTGLYLLTRRRLLKKIRSWHPQSHKKPALARHNYPGISIQELADRLSRFQRVLGYDRALSVDQMYKQIYRISL
jgi:surface carbohydrate biosynthesis protein